MSAPRPNVPVIFADTSDANSPRTVGPDAGVSLAAATIAQDAVRRIEDDAAEMRWSARTRLIACTAMLALIAIASGAASVSRNFLPLDDQIVTLNTALRSWSGLGAIWGTTWAQPQRMPRRSPLGLSALLVQYQLFGHNAAGYRIVGLLIHATNVLLLWTLLRKLALPGALLAAATFAAHPVVADAVDWIARQPTLLCAAFTLSATIVYFRSCGLIAPPDDEPFESIFRLPRSRAMLWLTAFALFVAALLCDVAAATWPLVALLAIGWRRGRIARRDAVALIPFALLGAALAARHFNATASFKSAWLAPCFYASRAIIPLRVSVAYEPPELWQTWLSALATTAGMLALLAAPVALRRPFGRGAIAGWAAYLLMLAPAVGQPLADHRQYLALTIPLAAIAVLLAQRWRWHRPLAAAALIAAMLSSSIARSIDYRDEPRLWNAVLARDPKSLAAHNGLGRFQMEKRNDPDAAMRYFDAALSIEPNDAATHLNIAQLHADRRDWSAAMAEYRKALELSADDVDARSGVAMSYAGMGDDASAIAEYRRILQRDPGNAAACNNLGLLLAAGGDADGAIECYRAAIAANTRFVPARLNLSSLLFDRGDAPGALEQVLAVVRIDPESFEARFNAAGMLGSMGRLPEAESLYRAAVRLRPESVPAWRNLGVTLARQSVGQPRDRAIEFLNEAAACFRRAARLDPADPQAAELLKMADADRQRVSKLPAGGKNLPAGAAR